MKYGLAICGDPKRRQLAKALFEIYSSYSYLDEVNLYFRKNPAIAFNVAASEIMSDNFIGIAGDVYIGEKELFNFIDFPSTIVCAQSPLSVRRHDMFPYPRFGSYRNDLRFISGLFRMPTYILEEIPFKDKPSFCEDYFFNLDIKKYYGYEIVSLNVPCVHIDHHNLFRLRTFKYLILPERFVGMTLKQRGIEIAKMFGWEWQEVLGAILNKSINQNNFWEYEMSYIKKGVNDENKIESYI